MTPLTVPVRACPMCGSFRRLRFVEKDGGRYMRCRSCATIYSDPRPNDDVLLSRLNDFAPPPLDGDGRAGAVAAEQWKLDLLAGLPLPGPRLLDVGAGTGAFVAAAAAAGYEAEGQDLAPAVAAAARRDFDVHVHGVPVRELEGVYDLVTVWDTLEHVTDPPGLLRDVARLLVPGGHLVALSPHADGLSGRILKGRWWVFGPADHLVMFSVAALTQAIELAGLKAGRVFTRQLAPPYPPHAADPDRAAMRLFHWLDRRPRAQAFLVDHDLGDWILATAGKRTPLP